jgi:hypothetical protein
LLEVAPLQARGILLPDVKFRMIDDIMLSADYVPGQRSFVHAVLPRGTMKLDFPFAAGSILRWHPTPVERIIVLPETPPLRLDIASCGSKVDFTMISITNREYLGRLDVLPNLLRERFLWEDGALTLSESYAWTPEPPTWDDDEEEVDDFEYED